MIVARVAFIAGMLAMNLSCGGQSSGTNANGADAYASALPQAAPTVENFAVSDLNKRGAPKLSAANLSQLKYVQRRVTPETRRRLRFAFARSGDSRLFVIYDGGGFPPEGNPSGLLPIILNPPSNATFHYDPVWNEVVQ